MNDTTIPLDVLLKHQRSKDERSKEAAYRSYDIGSVTVTTDDNEPSAKAPGDLHTLSTGDGGIVGIRQVSRDEGADEGAVWRGG